jgi:hypothetical protein
MSNNLEATTKQIGEELINMSASLDNKMEKWSDASKRPDNLSATECAGFINKEGSTTGLNLVIDIQAPRNKNEAKLRIYAIESRLDDHGHERFNNIQFEFTADHVSARAVAEKGGAITRDDVRILLHDSNTRLNHVVVSNQSGLDKASTQQLGERYDLTGNELEDTETFNNVTTLLNEVLPILKKSAASESSS